MSNIYLLYEKKNGQTIPRTVTYFMTVIKPHKQPTQRHHQCSERNFLFQLHSWFSLFFCLTVKQNAIGTGISLSYDQGFLVEANKICNFDIFTTSALKSERLAVMVNQR